VELWKAKKGNLRQASRFLLKGKGLERKRKSWWKGRHLLSGRERRVHMAVPASSLLEGAREGSSHNTRMKEGDRAQRTKRKRVKDHSMRPLTLMSFRKHKLRERIKKEKPLSSENLNKNGRKEKEKSGQAEPELFI